jgi:hypothetical protein
MGGWTGTTKTQKVRRPGDRVCYVILMVGTIEVFPIPAAKLTLNFSLNRALIHTLGSEHWIEYHQDMAWEVTLLYLFYWYVCQYILPTD